MATAQKNTYGKRRRFRGRTVLPTGEPRSSMANAKLPGKGEARCKPSVGFSKNPVYERGQIEPTTTKQVGKFKVSMPRNRTKFRGKVLPIGATNG